MTMFLKPVFPVIEYIVNYDYIVNELCENKQIPESNCNGKCHLMKELAKASDSERPVSSDKKGYSSALEVLFFQEINSLVFAAFSSLDKEKNQAEYSNLYSTSHLESLFRPPIFMS